MCAIDYCDDRFTVYRTHIVARAKKAHRCDECRRDIAAGEPYLYAFGVFDGDGTSYYTCCHCHVAVKWLTDNCGGFLHGGVGEDIEEHTREYPNLAFGLNRYVLGMRRKWRRFSGGGLMHIPPLAKPIDVSVAASAEPSR